jgi:hypothetical protein
MGVNERHEISTAIGTYLAMDCVERGSGYHLRALSGNTPQHFFCAIYEGVTARNVHGTSYLPTHELGQN